MYKQKPQIDIKQRDGRRAQNTQHTHTQICTRTRVRIHTCACARTHASAHACTHTYTHTHKDAYVSEHPPARHPTSLTYMHSDSKTHTQEIWLVVTMEEFVFICSEAQFPPHYPTSLLTTKIVAMPSCENSVLLPPQSIGTTRV